MKNSCNIVSINVLSLQNVQSQPAQNLIKMYNLCPSAQFHI